VLPASSLRNVGVNVVPSGSGCGVPRGEPSNVLLAIGGERALAEGSICFTLGRWTTAREIDHVLALLPLVVADLRRPPS
jgi:cysteine desulfurase